MVTPSYMLIIADEFAPGHQPARDARAHGHLRRRALDRGRCAARSRPHGHRRGGHLRPVRGDGPGRGQRVHRDQGRPGDLGRPFLSRDHRPETGEVLPDGEQGRTGVHLADQGSLPHHPLPHPRPDAPAAAHGAQHAAHGQDRRPQRRHADHPRRQRVPLADRGTGAAAAASPPPSRRVSPRQARYFLVARQESTQRSVPRLPGPTASGRPNPKPPRIGARARWRQSLA
jgi:hypothetical protein